MAAQLLSMVAAEPAAKRLKSSGAEAHTPTLFPVDFAMHAEQRARVCAVLRADPTVPHDAAGGGAVVLMQGGASAERNESDHELLFRQESSFQYLFGVREPDCYGAIDVATAHTTLFVPRLPASWAIFMGEIRSPAWFKGRYMVDECVMSAVRRCCALWEALVLAESPSRSRETRSALPQSWP